MRPQDTPDLTRASKWGRDIDNAFGNKPKAGGAAATAGRFYALQMFPEAAPGRIKLGWSGNLKRRLKTYAVGAPTAILLRSWPCLRLYESRAIEYVAARATHRLSPESFDFPDVDGLLRGLDDFFLVLETFRAGGIRPTIERPELRMLRPGAGTDEVRPTDPLGDPHLGKVVAWEIDLPWKAGRARISPWLEERLWSPLTSYFAEVAASEFATDGRRISIRIEIVK